MLLNRCRAAVDYCLNGWVNTAVEAAGEDFFRPAGEDLLFQAYRLTEEYLRSISRADLAAALCLS